MTTAITIFAKKMTREKRIPFEVSVDPFYSESNMSHLRRGIEALNAGKGIEHDNFYIYLNSFYTTLILIMSLTRNNLYDIINNPIYQPIYIINPSTPKSTHISFELKKNMEQTCQELGMNMTTAITIFAKKMTREKRIPRSETANLVSVTSGTERKHGFVEIGSC